jgi:hypothetical protein
MSALSEPLARNTVAQIIYRTTNGTVSQNPRRILTGRIVICELLNSFPSTAYPNPVEMHANIQFGIRPLLYSILRRQFFHPRGFSICPNTECHRFFNIERAGQRFCDAECSRRQRQRDYWQTNGKKMRERRKAKPRKRKKRA